MATSTGLIQFKLDKDVKDNLNNLAQSKYGMSPNQLFKTLSYEMIKHPDHDILSQAKTEYIQVLPDDRNISDEQLDKEITERAKGPTIPFDTFMNNLKVAGKKHFGKEIQVQ